MNLIYADLTEVFSKDGMRMGKIRIGGALRNIPLDLLPEANCGDRLLVCEGVAHCESRIREYLGGEICV